MRVTPPPLHRGLVCVRGFLLPSHHGATHPSSVQPIPIHRVERVVDSVQVPWLHILVEALESHVDRVPHLPRGRRERHVAPILPQLALKLAVPLALDRDQLLEVPVSVCVVSLMCSIIRSKRSRTKGTRTVYILHSSSKSSPYSP
ncbi:hypothetical protein FA13DRAFT_597890 [Coprinellus micaceus]|uniref:Uncharacterized protein n=1 Tax=Coprinellus micaceus TaxID=71717 RepID=A0A4Y7T8A8_COPMI|nr:hypothetical protein FA13DRAFT_597890 [Coprinellus micaceus]